MSALFDTSLLQHWLLLTHRSFACLTIIVFVWRGIYIWKGKPISHIYRRVIPDVIDVCLLTSGVLLAIMLGVAPWHDAWLATKLIAVILYILAGFFAFRKGAVVVQRSAFFLSLGLFIYIVSIAHTMRPMPWL
jgi:uncharacterized membrane protein SirB2